MLRRACLALALLVLGATAASAADEPARPVPGDNALSTSGPALLRADRLDSLRCAGDVAGSPFTPVLLLHGTGSTPEESWGPVYLPQLAAQGRPACTVQLPDRATGDMQVSTEVVVAAVREVARQRGGRIDVVGHSQGATLAVTALKYWPDLPGLVEDYVGLAPTLQPGVTGDVMCLRPCSAPFQQRRSTSVYFASVTGHPLPPGPSYTTIATRFDEIAAPAPEASRLDGATNVVLQDVCPAKPVEHFGLVVDGTVYALVQDGLLRAGPVDPSRLPVSACLNTLPPGSDPTVVAPLVAEAVANDLAANAASEKLTEEPPVRCYVRPDCADVDDRGRLLLDAVAVPGGVRLRTQAPGAVQATVVDAAGTALATAAADVGVGTAVLPLALPAGASEVRLTTTTSFYGVPGLERTLAVTAAPPAAAGERLPRTGGSAALLALALLAAGLLLQRGSIRPSA